MDCKECGDTGSYYTEWSDSADSHPQLRRLVIYRPDPPDGTVVIRCIHCKVYQEQADGTE